MGEGLRADASSPAGSSSTTPLTVGSAPRPESPAPAGPSAHRRRLLCHDRTVSEATVYATRPRGHLLRIDGIARQALYARRR